MDDFKNYKINLSEPEPVYLKDGYKIYTPPPPSSGLMVSFIMNVMKGFDFEPESEMSNQTLSLFYQRLIETFKHAYAKRSKLGDAEFIDVSKVVDELRSDDHANEIRKKIDDSKTFPQSYYGTTGFKEDHGTGI